MYLYPYRHNFFFKERMYMNMKKRLFSVLFAVLMLVAALPLSASALTSDLTVLLNNAEANGTKTILLEYDAVLNYEDAIPEGLTVIVPEGKTLTVYGKLTVNGSLIVRGYLNNKGSIVNEDKVLVHSGNGEYDPLDTYTCSFCGKQHTVGKVCPFVNYPFVNYPFASYYCPTCEETHEAGYICYFYNFYYGNPYTNSYYCYACKNYHVPGNGCGGYIQPNWFYCTNCEKYHVTGYVCTEPGNDIEYEYCKSCAAYHLKGVDCGLLASPTKYQYVEECGHYHKVGEAISHPTYNYCIDCGYCHDFHIGCITDPYNKNYCYSCGYFHAEGQHANYHYCSLCKKYHFDGQHSNYTYCYLCERYYAGSHDHKSTDIYCNFCRKYHAPNLHTHFVPSIPSYNINSNVSVNFASPAKVTLSDITASLAAVGLSTKALGFERTFGDLSALNAQDFYYIVYATLLNAGEISQVSDETAILNRFYNKNRIANISEYKSAIAYFASVGVINNFSMNPRQPISTDEAKMALQYAISVAK